MADMLEPPPTTERELVKSVRHMIKYTCSNLINEPQRCANTLRHGNRKDEFLMQFHSTITPSFPENLQNYAPWVAQHGLMFPYGQCQCGCGRPAPIARRQYPERGAVIGQPQRYRKGHQNCHASLAEAFWRNVAPGEPDACWEWQGAKSSEGYGHIRRHGRLFKAHRIAYELEYGSIPEGQGYHGMCVLHRCDNPGCVNPAHLFVGSNADNVADKVRKNRQYRPIGEAAPAAKLTASHIREIRSLYARGGISKRALARRYGVAQSTMRAILARGSWRHID